MSFEEQKNFFEGVTPEQRREYGRKGGLKKGENARKRREARDVIEVFLTMPLKKGKVADVDSIKSFMDLKGKNITVDQALHLQVVQKALKGDLSAYQTILSLTGEKPSDKMDVKIENPYQGLTTEELKKLADEK